MDSVDQAKSQAWSLWAKLAAPALLRCPVLGISAVLVVSTPLAAAARALPRSQEFVSAEPTQRQLHVLRSYERYLARMKAQTVKAGRAVKFAYRQIGKPYQWGGAGPRTYDCSGLVMAAWRRGGLRLPHRADLQHRMIHRKVGLKHLRPGDLVFFSGDNHVGIYVGRHHFLHAPHTGARVQRGTLSGWRLRAFAGAARPGAPAYHAWPHWVRSLADHLHTGDHGSNAKPHGRHGYAHPVIPADPETTRPDADRPDDAPVVEPAAPETVPQTGPETEPESGPETGDVEQGQAPGAEAAQPPAPEPAAPAAPPVMPEPAHTPDRAPAVPPAAHAPSFGTGGLSVPLLNMSAPSPIGRHHVLWRHTPVPQPGEQGQHRPHRHWPRSSVQQQNDEQRFDRDFDGHGDDEDIDAGNDGLDLRSLLGAAP